MRFQNIRGRERGTNDAWRLFATHAEAECPGMDPFTVCDNCVMEWSGWEFEVHFGIYIMKRFGNPGPVMGWTTLANDKLEQNQPIRGNERKP